MSLAVHNKQHLLRLNLRENELEDRGALQVAKVLGLLPAIQVEDREGGGEGGSVGF